MKSEVPKGWAILGSQLPHQTSQETPLAKVGFSCNVRWGSWKPLKLSKLSMGNAWDIYRRVLSGPTRKDVTSGMNDAPLIFWSQTPKNEILGPWIRLSSVNDKILKSTYNLNTILVDHDENFKGSSHHEWAFVSGPRLPQQIHKI